MEQKIICVTAVPSTITVLSLLITITLLKGVQGTIGVNYGQISNNLPPPPEVARFLHETTVINRVRLFDSNPVILKAFAHTGIAVTITVPNQHIPDLTKLSFAQNWVRTNVLLFIPDTNIIRLLVVNEVLSAANKLLIGNLIPAMQNLPTALVGYSLDRRIKVSTPHSLVGYSLDREREREMEVFCCKRISQTDGQKVLGCPQETPPYGRRN